MTDDMTTPSGQDREGARAAMRDLPGETALGFVDPASVDGVVEGQTPVAGAARDAGFTPDVATARDGDESTGGEAARQALGVDPRETSGGEVPDRSQGQGTRADLG